MTSSPSSGRHRHPALDAFRVELGIPREIERIGEVDAAPVAAQLDHLRRAVQRAAGGGMPRSPHDAAHLDDTGELRGFGIRHVVLTQLAGSPAGDIEEAIVETERDVGHQRRNGLERLERRRQLIFLGRLSRNFDHLLGVPGAIVVAVPLPDRRRKVVQVEHRIHEPVGVARVVRWPQLQHDLVLFAEIDRLGQRAVAQVPEMQPVAVLARRAAARLHAGFHHVGRAPFAGDHGVVPEMPPEIVVEVLIARGRSPTVPARRTYRDRAR